MRRFIVLLLLFTIAVPVNAAEFTAPEAPGSVAEYVPDQVDNFGEDLWFVINSALKIIWPSIIEAMGFCVSLIAVTMIVSVCTQLSAMTSDILRYSGGIVTAVILIQPSKAMIHLGIQTVQQLSQYGKLLIPVMTGAMAAQGGVTKAGALYTATAFFDALLSGAITDLLIPLVYVFLCISIVSRVFSQTLMKQIGDFTKWVITWGLKTVLYIFTGYISITGVVSGSADLAALKATKLAITGAVPLVGGILSDASESVLVSIGIMKASVGVYGVLVIVALWLIPFLQIGVHYLLLKVTSGLCQLFDIKETSLLVKDFADAAGLVLAMTGAVCLMLLISIICFMKGVG